MLLFVVGEGWRDVWVLLFGIECCDWCFWGCNCCIFCLELVVVGDILVFVVFKVCCVEILVVVDLDDMIIFF